MCVCVFFSFFTVVYRVLVFPLLFNMKFFLSCLVITLLLLLVNSQPNHSQSVEINIFFFFLQIAFEHIYSRNSWSSVNFSYTRFVRVHFPFRTHFSHQITWFFACYPCTPFQIVAVVLVCSFWENWCNAVAPSTGLFFFFHYLFFIFSVSAVYRATIYWRHQINSFKIPSETIQTFRYLVKHYCFFSDEMELILVIKKRTFPHWSKKKNILTNLVFTHKRIHIQM